MRGRACAAGALAFLFPFAAGSAFLGAPSGRVGASAPARLEGAPSAGAFLAGEDCPVAVEEELLTVNIPEFPSPSGGAAAFAAYRSNVTAKYTLRNPTEGNCTATMLFPFGGTPEYTPFGYDFYGDTARYTVKENGAEVAAVSRHSYSAREGGAAANPVEEIGSLAGTGSGFFREDTPVTTHTFRITVPAEAQTEANPRAALLLAFKADPARTRIAASLASDKCIEKGLAVLMCGLDLRTAREFDFSVYAFGEDAAFKEQKVCRAASEPVFGARVEEIATTTGSFGAFAEARYDECACGASGMTKADWLIGFSEALEEYACGGMMCERVPDDITPADFMRWYEYDLQIPAGETLVNEVSAPIYPTVRGSGETARYEYTYLLSPARRWASFGRLRVELNTPYFLTASSLEFERTETGYALEWEDGLPLGELTFTLSAAEPQEGEAYAPYDGGLSALFIALIVLACVAAVSLAVTVVLVVRRKKSPSPPSANAEEGKVDLPADETDETDEKDGKGR